MRLRFAPSPTGQLHVGNARTALFNWLLARGHAGTFLLRIEDTDSERSTLASERAILEDLRWLGLAWDEGPEAGGAFGPYRQSERLAVYREHADRLRARGDAYYCFCSPEQIDTDRRKALALGLTPKYPGRCRVVPTEDAAARVAAGEPATIRFRVPPGRDVSFTDRVRGHVVFNTDTMGDPVIVRSDGRPAYNFAVVVDDGLMEVTHVIRGEDHVSNTPRQLLLYEALGYRPPEFAHLSLVMGPDHAPLSKRHGATSVSEFRARGILPEALVNYLALIGWSPGQDEELLPVDELARRFSLDDVTKSAGIFDVEKLSWVNRHYLRSAAPERLAALVVSWFERADYCSNPDATGLEYLASLMPMAQASVDRLDEVASRLAFLVDYDPRRALSDDAVRAEMMTDGSRAVAAALTRELTSSGRIADRDAFRALAGRVKDATGQKGKGLFHPIRIVLTGGSGGPELDLAVPAIDRGAELPTSAGWRSILGCRERAAAFVSALERV